VTTTCVDEESVDLKSDRGGDDEVDRIRKGGRG